MHHHAAHKTTPARKPRISSGWSAERRVKHAAALRRWKPWEKSTGPRTQEGKAKSARNACKPGVAALRLLNQALSMQARYLVDYKRFMRMQKLMEENELLKQCRRAMVAKGRDVTDALIAAFYAVNACENMCGAPG